MTDIDLSSFSLNQILNINSDYSVSRHNLRDYCILVHYFFTEGILKEKLKVVFITKNPQYLENFKDSLILIKITTNDPFRVSVKMKQTCALHFYMIWGAYKHF